MNAQRGLISSTVLVWIVSGLLLSTGVYFGFREFKSNYLEIGELRATEKFRDQVEKLKDDLVAKGKEIEAFAKEKADAVKVAQEELSLAHQSEIDTYKKTIAAAASQNKKLLAELTKARSPTDRPINNTTPGQLSDVAVNAINRMLTRFGEAP